MSKKIYGIPVATPIRPDKFVPKNIVKTVNGVTPDKDGNVAFDVSENINDALAQAKQSGAFDGPAGPQGEPGATPEKGVDYYTDADKEELKKRIYDELKENADVVKEALEKADAYLQEQLDKKASAGFGYGEPMEYIVDETGTFDDKLTTILAGMVNHQCKQFSFYDTKGLIGYKFVGKLWKYTGSYAVLEAVTYHNLKALKRFYNGVWQPWEWENPPMTANIGYRTTERINGKAVYRIADSAGNVMYRLDGDNTWRSYSDLVGSNSIESLVERMTTSGYIASGSSSAGAGTEVANTSYVRSDYIAVSKGDIIKYSNMNGASSIAVILVYNSGKSLLSHVDGITTSDYLSGMITIAEDGYVRLSNRKSVLSTARVELHTPVEGNIVLRKTLNILALGSSFCQDSFAYLPPVLNEILPDYSITYGVAHTDSTALADQVNTMIPGGTAYQYFNYWDSSAVKWDRQENKTFEDIMAMKKWDIIYLQPDGSQSDDALIDSAIITPGRKMLRWLQELNGGPFSLMVGQHLPVSKSSYNNLCNGMQKAKQLLGIVDYIPIGAAFYNARTNTTLQAIGTTAGGSGGNMLWRDGKHMQAGIPALLAAYTIALKVLECVGESYRGIYGSTFKPTDDICFAINAADGTGGTHMTHGYSDGVNASNIRAVQEIAVLTVNNPTTVTDCSGIIVT